MAEKKLIFFYIWVTCVCIYIERESMGLKLENDRIDFARY